MERKLFIMTVLIIVLMTGTAFVVHGEGQMEPGAERKMKRATEQSMSEMYAQTGMPTIINWQERKLAKMIFELRDRTDLICYAYSYSEMTCQYNFIGKCMGYGLPYSVQYTNPSKIQDVDADEYVIPQADPNGLYMPDGLSAIWLMLIDPDTNEPKPVYMEPLLTVTPFPLPARICVDNVNK